MAEVTGIEWARSTFNPWIGCQKVGPGCDHCYAEAANVRFAAGRNWGPGAPRRRTSAAYWAQLRKWNARAAAAGEFWPVFGGSQCDPFDNAVDPAWRADYWREIRATPALTYILVTKRIGNVPAMLPADWGAGYSNVWLLITVVDQAEADRDVPRLLEVPAAQRGLSIEPMLGPIDLTRWLRIVGDAATGEVNEVDLVEPPYSALDWIIAGGESGPGARPAHPDWFRGLRDQCAAAGVPYFFKQWGEFREVDAGVDRGGDHLEVEVGTDEASAFLALAHSPSWIAADGRHFTSLDDLPDDVPCRLLDRLGKKAAGALLDGVEHRAFP